MAEEKTLKEQRDESLEKVEEDEDGNLSWVGGGSDLGEEIPEESSLSWMKRGSDLGEEIPPSDKPERGSLEERAATAGHAIGKVAGIDTHPEMKAALGRLVELGVASSYPVSEENLTKAKDLLTTAAKSFGTEVLKDKELIRNLMGFIKANQERILKDPTIAKPEEKEE